MPEKYWLDLLIHFCFSNGSLMGCDGGTRPTFEGWGHGELHGDPTIRPKILSPFIIGYFGINRKIWNACRKPSALNRKFLLNQLVCFRMSTLPKIFFKFYSYWSGVVVVDPSHTECSLLSLAHLSSWVAFLPYVMASDVKSKHDVDDKRQPANILTKNRHSNNIKTSRALPTHSVVVGSLTLERLPHRR